MIQTRIEKAGLLDRIAGARAAVPGCLATANQALQGLLELTLDKDVVACRWKSEDTLAARLSEAAGKFHCWQGRNRMAIDALGLDVEGKLGEALVVSRDGSGNVIQKQAGGSARGLFAAGKPMTVNDAAMPEVGEALAVVRDGRLVRLASVVYKDPVTGLIATLETNEVPADALTCAPTFGWYALLRPRYDLKTFHGTYCTGQPACTTLVLAPATRGTYATEPECKCYTCGKSTRLAKALPRPASAAKAPAPPPPAAPDAAHQTKEEVAHDLDAGDFTGAYTRLDVQSMPQMLEILDLLDLKQIELLLANLDKPHGRYTERLRAALVAAGAAGGRAAPDAERFAADVASIKTGDPEERQKKEIVAYLEESKNDEDASAAVGALLRRLQSTVAQSPEVDGWRIVAVSGDPIAAGTWVRYRVVSTSATLGEPLVNWQYSDLERAPDKFRRPGNAIGGDSPNNRVLDDDSFEKRWEEPGTYEVVCLVGTPGGSSIVAGRGTRLRFVQTVTAADAADSPLTVAFEANVSPPDYARWRETLAPSKPPPPLKSRIECDGPSPTLVASGTEHTYTIVPAEGAKTFFWYVRGTVADTLSPTYTENGNAYRRAQYDGDEVIVLPTSDGGRSATWVLSLPGRFLIVCEQEDGNGHVLSCAYEQIIEDGDAADARARQQGLIRRHLAAAADAVSKLKYVPVPDTDPDPYGTGRPPPPGARYSQYVRAAVPVRASYLNRRTGKVVTLPLYVGPAAAGGFLLLDLTIAADRMEYDGGSVAEAVETFRSRNNHPTGRIRLAVPPNAWGVAEHADAFDVTGPWTTRWAAVLGDVSLVAGLAASALPGGWVVGVAIFVSSAAWAASSALNVYDELEKREPDYAKVAIDVIGIAGGIIGATSGAYGSIWLKDMRRMPDQAGRFFQLAGHATATPGMVMCHFDAVRQLDEVLQREKDPQKLREEVQNLLQSFVFQELMLVIQPRDHHNSVRPHVNAEVEVHDHLLGVTDKAYWIEKAGNGSAQTLFERIEDRFKNVESLRGGKGKDGKPWDGEAPTTKKVVQQTRAGLDALDKNGASRARRKAYLDDQLRKILGASEETPFDYAYSIRDELIKEYIDPVPVGEDGKPIPDAKSSYRRFMKDVMRKLARDGLRYCEQSVSAKKLARAITAENVAGAREDLRSESHGRLDVDMRFLAMVETSTIANPRAEAATFSKALDFLKEVIGRGDVIGVDIAGPEAGKFDAVEGMKNVQTLYDLLKDAAKARNRSMVLRPHVGEGYAPPGAPERSHIETARHNMTTLLDHLKKTGYSLAKGREDGVVIRFGHAAHATPEQLKLMAQMGIYAEANLGSNEITGAMPTKEHPLLQNLYYDTPTILSTDGGGVMSTDLDREYVTAAGVIKEFQDGKRSLKIDGKDVQWSELSPDVQRRFDIDRLKGWAKAYGTLLKAGDRWSMDSRQRKIVFR